MPAKYQNSSSIPNVILQNIEKQMVPCKSTAEEVSFEWSHHRISSTDSKVRTTLHVFQIDSGSKRLRCLNSYILNETLFQVFKRTSLGDIQSMFNSRDFPLFPLRGLQIHLRTHCLLLELLVLQSLSPWSESLICGLRGFVDWTFYLRNYM